MIPLRVSVKDFLCYEDQTFDFDGQPVWLLHGPNGSGKSAVFDAMLYALYGTYKRRASDNGDAKGLIRHGAKSFRVEFDFECRGRRWRVWRTRPHTGKTAQGACEFIDGQPLPVDMGNNQKDLDAWVERTLALSEESFVSAVLLRQGAAERLIDADADARPELFRGLIDLEPFQKLHKAVDEERKEKGTVYRLLKGQQENLTPVSDGDVTAAEEAHKSSADHAVRAREAAEHWQTMAQAARQWDAWRAERTRVEQEIAAAQERATCAVKLRADAERLKELTALLPRLAARADAEEKHTACETHERELRQAVDEARTACEQHEGFATAAEAERQTHHARALELDRTLTTLAAEHKQLRDEIARAIKATNALAERDETERQWRAYPANLDEQRRVAEADARDAQSAKDLLPPIQTLLGQRAVWRAARDARDAIDLARHEAAVKDTTAAKEVAKQREAAATQARAAAREEYAVANDRLKGLRAKREQFLQATGAKTCSACGQPIDAKHAERERAALDQQMASAEADLAAIETRGKAAKTTAERAATAATSAVAAHREAELALSHARQRHTDAERRMAETSAAYLPVRFGKRAELSANSRRGKLDFQVKSE